MLLETFSLSLNFLLILPASQIELPVKIDNIRAIECMHMLNCRGAKNLIGQNSSPNDSPDSKPNKKTCKYEDKVLQEGEEIERRGIKLVCKNGELKERANEES